MLGDTTDVRGPRSSAAGGQFLAAGADTPAAHEPLQRLLRAVLPLSPMCDVATLATLVKNTAAAATSAQIVKFMAAEW